MTDEEELPLPIVREDVEADEGYLPRSALTAPPTLSEPVFIAFPEDGPPGQWTATVTLFIDADGRVKRVLAASQGSPAIFEAAARNAFINARFSPGEVDGHPVRSRIRMEVEFSNLPAPGT